jgi:transcriptional regulator with XRE-family HTH domain
MSGANREYVDRTCLHDEVCIYREEHMRKGVERMNKSRVTEYRKRNHYSVKDVSIRLMEHDIDVAPKTIYGWESGQAQPTADTLLLLCEIYKIPDILNSFGYDQPDDPAASLTYHEREIIYAYRNRPELQHAVDILLGCD